jgi:hypothetical protein
MRIEVIDPNGAVIQTEHTVTEEISTKGATLFTMLEIPLGRFVRLSSDQYNITAHAAIRSVSKGADGVPRIHVEFIDKEWPL